MYDTFAIELSGSNFEIGQKHGENLKDLIQTFVNDDFTRINKLVDKQFDEKGLFSIVSEYKQCLQEYAPDFFEEVKGISAGAEITLDEAVLLQFRREVIGISPFSLTGDCTSFAHHNEDDIVLGQTIDLNGDMTELGQVYRIKKDDKRGVEILQYSFAGLLGYMGMNNLGVAVAINLVVSNDWKIGISPYLLVRKFLECGSIEECIAVIEGLPIASSRSFLISDKNRTVNIEVTPTEYKVYENKYLSHTNHFLDKDFLEIDKLNFFSKNSSCKRKNIIDEFLEGNYSFENIKSAFSDHSIYPVGICAHNMDNIRLNETVASVVMYPRKGHFYALKGKPCKSNYKKYELIVK